MKILFVAPRYHTNQHFIVKTLIQRGHAVRFFALYRGGSEEYSALKPEIQEFSTLFKWLAALFGDPDDKISAFKQKYAFPSLRDLYTRVREMRPDIVIVRDFNNFSKATILVARLLSLPTLFYSQQPLCAPKSIRRSIRTILFKMLWGRPVVRITPAKGFCSIYPRVAHLYYVPFVVDFGYKLTDKVYFRGDRVNILAVGKFQQRKNHMLLLAAVKDVASKFPVRLTIVGERTTEAHDANFSEVQEYITAHDLETLVTIKTNLSFAEMQREYMNHDIFVLPSTDELFAISVLEAMAFGLPVICSDTNGAQYTVTSGTNGYVFRSDNAEDLKQRLESLVSDRKIIMQMGKAAYGVVGSENSPDEYYRRFSEVVRLATLGK